MPSNLLLTKIGTAILQLAARVGATGGSGFGVPSRKKKAVEHDTPTMSRMSLTSH
jgi:hypothetical protein